MTKPREISPNGVYHVVVRGNNKMDVFCDEEDNLKFLYILSDLKDKENIDIYAYCLMVNHAHIMLRVKGEDISEIMRSLVLRYVKWYNKKYERTGKLFQDRFFSNPVTNSSYFIAGLQYIYNNPVKAGLCSSPTSYKWSSFSQLFMKVPSLPQLTPSIDKLPLANTLLSVMDSPGDMQEWEPRYHIYDTEAMEIVKTTTGIADWKEVQGLPEEKLKSCVDTLLKQGCSKKQIMRLLGVSRYNMKKLLC